MDTRTNCQIYICPFGHVTIRFGETIVQLSDEDFVDFSYMTDHVREKLMSLNRNHSSQKKQA